MAAERLRRVGQERMQRWRPAEQHAMNAHMDAISTLPFVAGSRRSTGFHRGPAAEPRGQGFHLDRGSSRSPWYIQIVDCWCCRPAVDTDSVGTAPDKAPVDRDFVDRDFVGNPVVGKPQSYRYQQRSSVSERAPTSLCLQDTMFERPTTIGRTDFAGEPSEAPIPAVQYLQRHGNGVQRVCEPRRLVARVGLWCAIRRRKGWMKDEPDGLQGGQHGSLES